MFSKLLNQSKPRGRLILGKALHAPGLVFGDPPNWWLSFCFHLLNICYLPLLVFKGVYHYAFLFFLSVVLTKWKFGFSGNSSSKPGGPTPKRLARPHLHKAKSKTSRVKQVPRFNKSVARWKKKPSPAQLEGKLTVAAAVPRSRERGSAQCAAAIVARHRMYSDSDGRDRTPYPALPTWIRPFDPIGVLFGFFAGKIDGPGLPGGLITKRSKPCHPFA